MKSKRINLIASERSKTRGSRTNLARPRDARVLFFFFRFFSFLFFFFNEGEPCCEHGFVVDAPEIFKTRNGPWRVVVGTGTREKKRKEKKVKRKKERKRYALFQRGTRTPLFRGVSPIRTRSTTSNCERGILSLDASRSSLSFPTRAVLASRRMMIVVAQEGESHPAAAVSSKLFRGCSTTGGPSIGTITDRPTTFVLILAGVCVCVRACGAPKENRERERGDERRMTRAEG